MKKFSLFMIFAWAASAFLNATAIGVSAAAGMLSWFHLVNLVWVAISILMMFSNLSRFQAARD